MNTGLIFFCCACVILLFTIINLSVGPIVSRGGGWGTLNCAQLSDGYDDRKDQSPGLTDDEKKYYYQRPIDECNNKKAMNNMEYTAFIFDIVIGFICGLLGLLHYFDVKKDFIPKTGLIGFICGIIGFIFTFVYLILNGLVYTNYGPYPYDLSTGTRSLSIVYPYIKLDSDGVFAELEGSEYKLIYFDKKENYYALYPTYSDLGKKQYNYDRDMYKAYKTNTNTDKCYLGYTSMNYNANGYITHSSPTINTNCKKLYKEPTTGISNKDISDRFLTALILSLFVCIANIGLALFGFLLWKSPDGFSALEKPPQTVVVPVSSST